jgi:GGDEF domain-containing protein
VQHDEALLRPTPGTTSADGPSVDAGLARADRPETDPPPLTALPRTRVRPLSPRAHVRLPGATAAAVERLAWGDTSRPDVTGAGAAVSVVPGAPLPVAVRRDVVSGADLDVLIGSALESGCAPGRHRRPHPAWALLKRLPGWRPLDPPAEGTGDPADAGDTADADHRADADMPQAPPPDARTDAHHQAGDTMDTDTTMMTDHDEARRNVALTPQTSPGQRSADSDTVELPPIADVPVGSTHADSYGPSSVHPGIPVPRDPQSEEPVSRRRRRRPPAPGMLEGLQAAQARIESASGRGGIARAVTEEAGRLVEADVTALVLRAVEGPRVLWLHPGGPNAEGLWGPATLAALLRVGRPVRRVVEGDPLAEGEATALLTVPVPAGGTVAGTLLARRSEPRTFSATEQDVLSRLARMAGAALLATALPVPRGREDVDGVTGLPGSRRFTAEVEAAVRTSQRQGMPVAVLAVHITGLSRLRTELGAEPADDALQTLAQAMSGVLRVGDLAYRIGPDELALLLPATDEAALDTVRERLSAVAGGVVARLDLPGGPWPLALRTAPVPLDGVGAGRQVVDAASGALELDRPKVSWTPAS